MAKCEYVLLFQPNEASRTSKQPNREKNPTFFFYLNEKREREKNRSV